MVALRPSPDRLSTGADTFGIIARSASLFAGTTVAGFSFLPKMR